ncbi:MULTISPECIES: TetR/AcrR family transcriptional regulator [Oerskovia]|uniref:TetR/AcrR family transcriptional regulator n=1 Tax=Oerskovia rustica TaxID=2762237 RepID=A0ABR8RX85_9CELL|nr:TetR/AcrR family transcriptional regulator [Oerskovia rustica]MBD7952405.1 TetR/AcrR family transcriptional regulator [Oerskovia rustica]
MSPTRAEKARATRTRILDAASGLFVENGWTRTSVEDVARAAGVATQTIYYTFGTKHALFKELLDVSVAGDHDDVATLERPWARAVLAEPDATVHLALHVAGARAVLDRVAPLLRVLRDASPAVPELGVLWAANQSQRRTVAATLTAALADKARLRTSTPTAADVTYTLLGPDTYGTLVLDGGWTPPAWQDWATDALQRQLLP